MKFQRAHQSSAWSPKNSPRQQTSQFASQSFAIEPQQESGMPPTQEQIENEAFDGQKFEATGLQLKQKDGSITPQEQERLGVLQAKMDGLLTQRVERASRFGHNFANIAVNSPDSSELAPIQAKLTIGQPGDKYEQEADSVASQVVSQINQPQSQTIQREEMVEEEDRLQMQPQISTIQRQEILGEEENELQMKSDWGILQREAISGENDELQMQPQISTIQREAMPTEEEELQMKPMVQRLSDGDEMAASPDLEASIQQAKGSGQPLSDTIREPMEQAFGADFSGVRVHADAKSDELNQSIQAKAFTTGTDIFFRQGTYDPGSRGGQELIAHELTHVVQQSGEQLSRQTYDRAQPNLIQKAPPNPLPNQSKRYQDQSSGNFVEPGHGTLPRAGQVAATLLPNNLLQGLSPGNAHPLGWDWVAQISGAAKITDWVRFHLFNEKLGGLNNVTNLVPTTKGDNSRSDWTTKFEEKAKDDLWGRSTQKKPIHIEVQVSFHTQKPSPPVGNVELHKFPAKIKGNYWTWDGIQWNLSPHEADLDIDEPPLDPQNVEYYIIKTTKEMLKKRFSLNEWLADRLIDLSDIIRTQKGQIRNEQDFYNVLYDSILLYVGEDGKRGSAQRDLDRYWPSLESLLQNQNQGIKLSPFKGWTPSGTNAVLHRNRIISLKTVIAAANSGGQLLNTLATKLNINQNYFYYMKLVEESAEDTEQIYQQIVEKLKDSTNFDQNIWPIVSRLFSSKYQIYFINGVKEKPVKTNTQKLLEFKQVQDALEQKRDQLKSQLKEPLVITYFEKEAQDTIEKNLSKMQQENNAFKLPLEFQQSGEYWLQSNYDQAHKREEKAAEIQKEMNDFRSKGDLDLETLNYFLTRSASLKEDIYRKGFTIFNVSKIFQDSQLIDQLKPLLLKQLETHLQAIPEITEEQRHAKEQFQREADQGLKEIYTRSFFSNLQDETESYKGHLKLLEEKLAKEEVYQAVQTAMNDRMEANGLGSDVSRTLGNSLNKFEYKIKQSLNLKQIKQVPEYIKSYTGQIAQAEDSAKQIGGKRVKLNNY